MYNIIIRTRNVLKWNGLIMKVDNIEHERFIPNFQTIALYRTISRVQSFAQSRLWINGVISGFNRFFNYDTLGGHSLSWCSFPSAKPGKLIKRREDVWRDKKVCKIESGNKLNERLGERGKKSDRGLVWEREYTKVCDHHVASTNCLIPPLRIMTVAVHEHVKFSRMIA